MSQKFQLFPLGSINKKLDIVYEIDKYYYLIPRKKLIYI